MIDAAELNALIDIRQTAERAGAEFDKSGKRSRCPIHAGDNEAAFEIFDNGRAWSCHTRVECNRYGHDGIALLRALNNWSMQDVAKNIGGEQIDPQERQRRAAERAAQVERELQEKINQAQKALEELREARRWVIYHDALTENTRALWRARGIPDDWQNFWRFGYAPACPTFTRSASLTIPIFTPGQTDPLNIRHRLLSPTDPHDKYRPERAGFPALPFYSDPDLPIDRAERVIVVEGEIKAAVTLLTIDKPLWQVIGVPGKEAFRTVADKLQGHDGVWLIPDPGAVEDWRVYASSVGARLITLAGKIDDMLNAGQMDRQDIFGMLDQARHV